MSRHEPSGRPVHLQSLQSTGEKNPAELFQYFFIGRIQIYSINNIHPERQRRILPAPSRVKTSV
jgi:hypothetical protein